MRIRFLIINLKTVIYNIYVDNNVINFSSASPIINGISDNHAQILTIKNICETTKTNFL
jgi:hypothetical protein